MLWGHSELGYGKSRAISHGGRRGRRGWGDFGKELVVAWPMLRWPRRPPHNPRLPPPVLRRPTSRRPPATRESGHTAGWAQAIHPRCDARDDVNEQQRSMEVYVTWPAAKPRTKPHPTRKKTQWWYIHDRPVLSIASTNRLVFHRQPGQPRRYIWSSPSPLFLSLFVSSRFLLGVLFDS